MKTKEEVDSDIRSFLVEYMSDNSLHELRVVFVGYVDYTLGHNDDEVECIEVERCEVSL